MQNYFSYSRDECLKMLGSTGTGLSMQEVSVRLEKFKNLQIKGKKKKGFVLKFLSQFSDLMVLILLLSSVVSIVVGLLQSSVGEIVDGAIILTIVMVNAFLGMFQERKAEKSMEALQQMSQPECMVIREGNVVRENVNKLVPGDVILFEAGYIVPADCRLLESYNLLVDESSLTGESHPIEKNADCILSQNCQLAERKNMLYKGTIIASGRGSAVVAEIGMQTELGKIATAIDCAEKELTPLQKSIKGIGKILTIVILAMAAVTFVLEILARGRPLEAFLTAIAISVAAIPESMPAIITIIMSLGISRLAKQKAIIRRMHSVETLGCCDVICSDKTGTITQNRMTVTSVFCDEKFVNQEKPNDLFVKAILLCNDTLKTKKGYAGDPTEIALSEYCEKFKLYKVEECKKYNRLDEKSFDSKRKLMSTLNSYNGKTMFTKGAVDVLIKKCSAIYLNGQILPMTEGRRQKILQANEIMTDKALRVLGVAFKENAETLVEDHLVFIGLVGMIDPPRKETATAVSQCKKAGMRAIMITGDHVKTAFAIAKEVGIADNVSQVMTGTEIDKLSDEQLLKSIDKINVYARVSPENKAKIVSLLKEKGHIVAMTGDGVNDAPSLKQASIGIGMGQSGTDVVKEVADMIITDDNFATIIVAVKEGRKVYKNIQKTVKFLFAANMGEILSLFLATIIFPQLTFLLPVQILFVNLITDSLPAIALGLEEAESNIMEQKPRKIKEGIFSNGHGTELLFMGIVQTVIILLSFVIGLKTMGQTTAMTMAFYSLNMIQLFFLLSARTERSVFRSNPFKNRLMLAAFVFGFGVLAIIALTPLHEVLQLTSLSPILWIITILLSMSIVIINEVYKLFCKRKKKKGL